MSTTNDNAEHHPKVPAAAQLVARIGGTLAMIPAALISAQTLFRLGRMMDLSPSIAWLLPAALDIYAVTSIWVGFQIPEGHPARKSAIWNARFALALTVACNALSHALDLAGMKHGWSRRDLSLTLVSALPPIVVERLLHLQTMIATGHALEAVSASAPAGPETETAIRQTASASTPSGSGSTVSASTRHPVFAASASTRTASASVPSTRPTPPAPSASTSSTSTPSASTSTPAATRTANRDTRLHIIKQLITTAGGNPDLLPLKTIQTRFGVSQATASRMRKDAHALTQAATP